MLNKFLCAGPLSSLRHGRIPKNTAGGQRTPIDAHLAIEEDGSIDVARAVLLVRADTVAEKLARRLHIVAIVNCHSYMLNVEVTVHAVMRVTGFDVGRTIDDRSNIVVCEDGSRARFHDMRCTRGIGK